MRLTLKPRTAAVPGQKPRFRFEGSYNGWLYWGPANDAARAWLDKQGAVYIGREAKEFHTTRQNGNTRR